jgi:hypothetical protein
MLHKENYGDLKTPTESTLSNRTALYSSQSLYGLINKAETSSERTKRAPPMVNFVDTSAKKSQVVETRKLWNSPPKNSH